MNSKRIFKEIYDRNIWNDPKSRSGTGSNLNQTKVIRKNLPILLKQFNIKTLLDIPCGDFYWMNDIKPELEKNLNSYIGADLIDELIKENISKYSDSVFKFRTLDILKSNLPVADAVLCRDCLVHFSYADILKALVNIKKSKSAYLLTTTFPEKKNRNIVSGNWAPVNLRKFPFYFPKPVWIGAEGCDEFNGEYSDKSLAIWELRKVRLYKFRFLMILYTVYYEVRSLINGIS